MAETVNSNVLAWMESNIDEEAKQEILKMLQENETELIDSFYKILEFGTGGMRGKMGIGSNRINKYTIGLATQGFANYLKQNFQNLREIKVVVAYDSRNNSAEFAKITAGIFSANDIKVYLFDDLRPTPELSYAIRNINAQGGVVITASHNPKEYNGYKVYWEDGAQVVAPHDKNIINEVKKLTINDINFNAKQEKITIIGDDVDSLYLAELRKVSLRDEIIDEDLKIVYTPLHGTGIKLLPQALGLYGFKNFTIVEEQATPDGNFPTVKSPNPENAEALKMAVNKAKEANADIILATDPDADRIAVGVKKSDGTYELLNGNQTASILAYYIFTQLHEKEKIYTGDYIVKTIVTTDLLKDLAEKYDVKVYEVLTGFKYIAQIIREKVGERFLGGFEESYGYLFGDFVRDKDAIMSGLMVAEVAAWAKKQDKTLYDILLEIYTKFGFYKERLVNIQKEGIHGQNEIKQIMENLRDDAPAIINDVNVIIIRDYLSGVESNLFNATQSKIDLPPSNVLQFVMEDGTKITVRPSGTEPKIKLYFSVKDNLDDIQNFDNVSKELDNRIDNYIKAMNIS